MGIETEALTWAQAQISQLPPPSAQPWTADFTSAVRQDDAGRIAFLEQHGFPPLVVSFESIDELDHVIFVYRRAGRWGSVARSRDPGLHGRRAVFPTVRALALSYVDTYVDLTGRLTGYALVDLRLLGRYDWRLASTNVWKAERFLLDYPHRPIRSSDRRIDAFRKRYRASRSATRTASHSSTRRDGRGPSCRRRSVPTGTETTLRNRSRRWSVKR
jgi:hypothetical protein